MYIYIYIYIYTWYIYVYKIKIEQKSELTKLKKIRSERFITPLLVPLTQSLTEAYPLYLVVFIKAWKKKNSCEIENLVEFHLCKMCVISRSRVLGL